MITLEMITEVRQVTHHTSTIENSQHVVKAVTCTCSLTFVTPVIRFSILSAAKVKVYRLS